LVFGKQISFLQDDILAFEAHLTRDRPTVMSFLWSFICIGISCAPLESLLLYTWNLHYFTSISSYAKAPSLGAGEGKYARH